MKRILAYIYKKHIDYILFLVVANVLLKLWNISEASYWLDETIHIFNAQKSFTDIFEILSKDPNPPFYNLLLSAWIKTFSVSELQTRSLSVVFSILTAVLIFLFAKKHINLETAIYASLIFTVSNIHLYYAHETRGYTLITFLCVLSVYIFYQLLQKQSVMRLIWFIIVNTLLIYTHYLTVYIFVFEFIIALTLVKSSRRFFYFIFSGLFISALLLTPLILLNEAEKGTVGWLEVPNLLEIKKVVQAYASSFKMFMLFAAIIAVGFVLIFLIKKFKYPFEDKRNYLLFLLWFIIPVGLNILVSSLVIPLFLPRYTLYASIGLFILVAFIIQKLPVHLYIRIGIIAIILAGSIYKLNLNPYKGEDWKGAADFVKQHKNKQTLVVGTAWYQYASFTYYFDNNCFQNPPAVFDCLSEQNVYWTNHASFFNDVDASLFSGIILIQSHEQIADPENTLFNYLNDKFALKETKLFDGITIHLFDARLTDDRLIENQAVSIDFENPDKTGYHYPGGIVHFNHAASGKHVSITNAEFPYSSGYHCTGRFLKDSDIVKIKIKASCLFESIKGSAKLVVSFENTKEPYFWNAVEIIPEKKETWTEYKIEVYIPSKMKDDDIFKTYIWNEKGAPLYVDDFKIRFFTASEKQTPP